MIPHLFRTRPWNTSTHMRVGNGMEWKGMEEEGKNHPRSGSSSTVTSVTRGPVIDR